jgi:hypothetical protein
MAGQRKYEQRMEVSQFWLDSSDEFSSFSDGSCLALVKRVSSERLGADKSTGALHTSSQEATQIAVESKQNI